MPLDVVGEHTKKHVYADPIFQSMMNRPHFEVDGFQAAKRPLDNAELFVAADHIRARQDRGFNVGADDINAVESFLALNAVGFALVMEPVLLDLDFIVLAHLEASEHASHAETNDVLAT